MADRGRRRWAGSPYRALIAASVERWRIGRSPIDANARALGVTADDIAAWATTALDGWRTAFVEPARPAASPRSSRGTGGGSRARRTAHLALALPLDVLEPVNRAFHASLGADLDALGIVFDIRDRVDRPPVPVAYTTFGERPHRRPDGTWDPGRPVILEDLTDGGLGELGELVHETGHAIHIAGIRTRPAYADWPDSDALTEALGDIVAVDVHDPAWQRRWVPGGVAAPAEAARRGRFAETALDAAWALFEIRLPRDAGPRPQRPVDGDHVHVARDRAPPGVVVVGDARAARRGARVHGELRDRGGARGGPPGGDPRGARRLARRRPRLVPVGPRPRVPLRAGAILARRAARCARPAAVRGRAARRARRTGPAADRRYHRPGVRAPSPPPPGPATRTARLPLVAGRRPAAAARAASPG